MLSEKYETTPMKRVTTDLIFKQKIVVLRLQFNLLINISPFYVFLYIPEKKKFYDDFRVSKTIFITNKQ